MPDSVEALQKLAWLQERYMFDYPAATRTYELILARDPENWVAEAAGAAQFKSHRPCRKYQARHSEILFRYRNLVGEL